jgi:hypothetical protein
MLVQNGFEELALVFFKGRCLDVLGQGIADNEPLTKSN